MEAEVQEDQDDGVQIIILDTENFSQVIYEVQPSDTEVVRVDDGNDDNCSLEEREHCQPIDQSQILQIAFNSIVDEIVEDADGEESDTNQSIEIITLDENVSTAETTEASNADIAFGVEFEGNNISDNIELVEVAQRAVVEGANEMYSCQQGELKSFRVQGADTSRAQGTPFSLNKILCPKKPFGCAVCDMRFRDRSGLSKHMAQHTSDKPHECPHCLKSFGMESSWRKHISKFHKDETDFSSSSCCSLCKKVFKNEKSCKRHKQLVHDTVISDESFVIGKLVHECEKCNVLFGSQESLNRHTTTKHPSVPCFYCGMLFLTKPLMRQHSREIHNQERPYACYKCWKRFKTGPEASAHLSEAHNVDLKRRKVGPGRQKDDMYSTNYYGKVAKKFNEDRGIVESSEVQTFKILPESIDKDAPSLTERPEHAFDLAARLEGKLRTYPAVVAKRVAQLHEMEF